MASIKESLESIAPAGEATLEGNPLYESEIILAAIRESCGSDEEYVQLIKDMAIEMQVYDVIEDGNVALEAMKKIVVKDFRHANFNRIKCRTAIRLAKVNNDPAYRLYRKHRDLFLQSREKIYMKYKAKAEKEARRILKNAARKSGNMTSVQGKVVTDKLNKQIEKATDDANNTNND